MRPRRPLSRLYPYTTLFRSVAFPYEVHSIFENYQDTILLVDKGEKQVSSTVGHELMHNHPFAERRFRSEEHTSELQSRPHLVCRLLLEKNNVRSDHVPRPLI